jgi:hypothetical protein
VTRLVSGPARVRVVLRSWAQGAAARFASLPGWAQALVVWALARLVSFAIVERTARFQAANGWTGADPTYLEFAGIWDGDWYRKIAEHGYPVPLPRDAAGAPQQSEWAFYPAYPFLVRAVMTVLGTSWQVTAPMVSLALGAAAAVVVHRLFRRVAGEPAAIWGLVLVAVFPSSPVFQLAYTESLALLALATALYLLVTRRYLAAVPVVVLLGFSRAVALPFALVVLVHLVHRWRRRDVDRFGAGEVVRVVVLGLASAAAGVAWPVVVGLANSDLTVYADIQSTWRGGGETVWLKPWWSMSQYLLGQWTGPVALAVLLIVTAGWTTSRRGRALGPELPAWCAAYLAYLLVVVEPFTSMFRFLLLLFPLGLLTATSLRSRAHLLTWAAGFVALQVVWVVWLWRFIPPSDWPP